MRRKWFRLALIAFVVASWEAAAWLATAILEHKGYLYSPPRVETGKPSYEQRRKARRAVLGSPPLVGPFAFGGEHLDESGARRSPAFPDWRAQPSCVSTYGDSFVFAWNVDPGHAWPNQLAAALHCRVANYGMPGYGSDQAFLRYQRAAPDSSQVVILGHMGENLRRNLTRVRDLTTGGVDYEFKPRFVLSATGALTLVPLPDLGEQEYRRVVGFEQPLLKLAHETFQPGGGLVAPVPSFPFALSLLSSVRDYNVQARLRGNSPPWKALYQAGHPAHGMEITAAIMAAFTREARARHQHALTLILPEGRDLEYFERSGVWAYQPLLDRLRRDEIPFADFGPYLAAHQQAGSAYDNYLGDGHFNERSNALLSRFVAERLAERGWTPKP